MDKGLRAFHLQAFHGSATEKAAFLDRLRAHVEAGGFVLNAWDEPEIDRTWHAHGALLPLHAYEPELGIPAVIGHLEEAIFCGLMDTHKFELAKDWPLGLMTAIEPGADLSQAGRQFLRDLLTLYPGIDDPVVVPFVGRCRALLEKTNIGLDVDDYVEARALQDEIELTAPYLKLTHRETLDGVKRAAYALEKAAERVWEQDPEDYDVSADELARAIMDLAFAPLGWKHLPEKIADRLLALVAAAPREAAAR